MIKVYHPTKGQEKLYGTYPITEINTNITVRVQKDPNECIEESYNLQNIGPYKGVVILKADPNQIVNLLDIHSNRHNVCCFNH